MGSTPAALRGVTDRQLGVPPEQTRRSIERFRLARATGGPVAIELTYPNEAGGSRTLVGRAVALDDPEEDRYVFVAEDVTELRLLQANLVRADRLASLGSLSASIGHELGSTTAVAMGQVELAMKLAEQGARPEVLLERLREAQSALWRTTEVLRDMRALAVGAELGSETSEVNVAVDDVKSLLNEHARPPCDTARDTQRRFESCDEPLAPRADLAQCRCGTRSRRSRLDEATCGSP